MLSGLMSLSRVIILARAIAGQFARDRGFAAVQLGGDFLLVEALDAKLR